MAEIPNQTDAYPLNAAQLELIFNLPYYGALYLFKEPLTPSEVARRMQVPANVMHYCVKRLFEAGLLEITDDSSRSRTYQTVATRFLLSPELQPAVGEAVPAMLETMLSKLHRNFLKSLETDMDSADELFEGGPVAFNLDTSLIISNANPPKYGPWVSISTRALSAEQFQKVTQAVNAILAEVPVEEGERCTLAFLAYRGEGAM